MGRLRTVLVLAGCLGFSACGESTAPQIDATPVTSTYSGSISSDSTSGQKTTDTQRPNYIGSW